MSLLLFLPLPSGMCQEQLSPPSVSFSPLSGDTHRLAAKVYVVLVSPTLKSTYNLRKVSGKLLEIPQIPIPSCWKKGIRIGKRLKEEIQGWLSFRSPPPPLHVQTLTDLPRKYLCSISVMAFRVQPTSRSTEQRGLPFWGTECDAPCIAKVIFVRWRPGNAADRRRWHVCHWHVALAMWVQEWMSVRMSLGFHHIHFKVHSVGETFQKH